MHTHIMKLIWPLTTLTNYDYFANIHDHKINFVLLLYGQQLDMHCQVLESDFVLQN